MFCSDATNISGQEIRERSGIGSREIHLVAGGPPCQGISMMGQRALDDPRNALLNEFGRLVLELRPRYFLMENVAGLMVGKHRQLLDETIEMFEGSGDYSIVMPVKVLQAADYGTPQSRKRMILLGARNDVQLPAYPAATHAPRAIKGTVPIQPMTNMPIGPSVYEAISDLPDADLFPELLRRDSVSGVDYGEPSSYAARLRGLQEDPENYSPVRSAVLDELTSSARTVHTRKSIDRFESTEPGHTEPVSRFLRLHPEGISNTLRAGTASDRGAHTAPRPIHPLYPRVITVREAARLHGYPDWFRFHVTKWNGFRQIGNSVPVQLAHAVGKAILEAAGIEPVKLKTSIDRGSFNLLEMTSGEAHKYFGLDFRVIPQRVRKVMV